MNMGYHFDLTHEAMLTPLKSSGAAPDFSDDARSVARLANGYADLFQDEAGALMVTRIFYSLSFVPQENFHFGQLCNQQLLHSFWQRLVLNLHNIVKDAAGQEDHRTILLALGTSLHIVQDFYSHSNWAELDMPRRTGIADATYFDVLNDTPDSIEVAGRENAAVRLIRYPGEQWAKDVNSVYSQGGNSCGPDHDLLNKDLAGRPHFEWAYRAAYRASVEWLCMVRGWIVDDLRKEPFWNSMATFVLHLGDTSVREAAAMNEGTLRWMFTYPGKWKGNRKWDSLDMLVDDCPSVMGLGVTSSFLGVLPPLGSRWWDMALRLADGLMQARSDGNMRVFSRQTFLQKLNGISVVDIVENAGSFGWMESLLNETVGRWLGVEIADDDMVEELEDANEMIPAGTWSAEHTALVETPANAAVLNTAARRMADALRDRYDVVKWVHVTIPIVRDLDLGLGVFNVNNEEIGGRSDYWALISVDDRSYYESECVDMKTAYPNWSALTPVWGKSAVPVRIRVYESDPSDHTAVTMRLVPGRNDLTFTFQLGDGMLAAVPDGVDYYIGHDGTYIKSGGSGELRAGVVVKVARHGDRRIEFVSRIHRNDDGQACYPMGRGFLASVGAYAWHLDAPDTRDPERGVHHLYVFDAGPGFGPSNITRLRLGASKIVDPFAMALAQVNCENVYNGRFSAGGPVIDPPCEWILSGNDAEPTLTAKASDEFIRHFSVCMQTGEGADDWVTDPITVTLQDQAGHPIARYRLADFLRDDEGVRRNSFGFYWLERQPNIEGFTSMNPLRRLISEIASVQIEKQGDQEFRLQWLEIYVNDQLLFNSGVHHLFTASDSMWTHGIDIPKEAIFAEPPKVESRGIVDKPGFCNGKAHRYDISVTALLHGYGAAAPAVSYELPSHPSTEVTVTMTHPRRVDYRISMYINRHDNNHFDYAFTAVIGSGADAQRPCAGFCIPRPSILLSEAVLRGGDSLETYASSNPYLRFEGMYVSECLHFRLPGEELEYSWHFGQAPWSTTTQGSRLLIEARVPPYKYEFPVRLTVRDPYDVSEATETLTIVVPRLAAGCYVKHFGKIRSWFDGGNASIIKRECDAPDYEDLAASFREVRAEYEVAELHIVQYLSRDEEHFSSKVFDPTYTWTIPGNIRAWGVAKEEEAPAPEPRIVSTIHRVRPGVSAVRPDTNPMVDLGPAPEGPVIRFDVRNYHFLSFTVRCQVTDAVGQTVTVTKSLSGTVGMDKRSILQSNWMKAMLYFIRQYAELLDAKRARTPRLTRGPRAVAPLGNPDPRNTDPLANPDPRNMDPIWNPDPRVYEELTPVEEGYVREMIGLHRAFERYGDVRLGAEEDLQAVLSDRVRAVLDMLPEVTAAATGRSG